MTLQYRIAPEGQVRDMDDGKREAIVDIPWEVIDTYQSDFARDCFDEFLSKRSPVVCWQHQRPEPIGRVRAWEKTANANRFRLGFSDFDAVPRARQAYTQMRDGDITDVSFGFDQATPIQHPEVRGAIRFTRARMPEISPVTVGSIPGAVAVAIRAEAEVANVRGLVDAGAISEDEGQRMLREAGIELPLRERETIQLRDLLADAIRQAGNGARAVTIAVADDGTVSVNGAQVDQPDDPDNGADDESPAMLAQAVDAALDSAAVLLADVDRTSLPANVQQALALVDAAGETVDSLLDELGVDPDDDNSDMGREAELETRAVSDAPWNFDESDYSLDQLKSACLIVLNGGKTKEDCKLPVKTPDGTLNRNACHAAASVLAGGRGGVQAPTSAKIAAAKSLVSIYRNQLNETPPESLLKLSQRAEDDATDLDLELQVRAALLR